MAAIGSGGGVYGTVEDDFRDKLSVLSGNSDDLEEGEIIGDESSDSLKSLIRQPHPLEHSWTFWYDDPSAKQKQKQKQNQQNQDDWGASIRSIYTFSTVEEFWSLYNNIHHPSKLTLQADFYCFKNKIEPKWEDPICANGGSWTINLSRGKSDTPWLHTLLAMIGEQFDHGDEICGAVVNIRKQERISIWTKDAKNEAAQISIGKQWKEFLDYNETIGFVVHDDALKTRYPKNRYSI